MADVLDKTIQLLRQLPGIGEKSATRMTFSLLESPKEYALALSNAIQVLVERIHPCSTCGNLTEQSPCSICRDSRRDSKLLCIVERVVDLLAIERSSEYRGMYHVLNGVLNPLKGIGPEQLQIEKLLSRLPGSFSEIILASSSSVEGDATALYLKRITEPMGIRISRIASGIPVGGELEYVDRSTIGRALNGRVNFS